MNELVVMVEAFGVMCFVAVMSAAFLIIGIATWHVVKGKKKS